MYEIVQHTADVRIQLVSPTAEDLFADAVRGLMSVMAPIGAGGGQEVTIELDAPDRTALLVDFLNEVLLRCHVDRQSFEPQAITIDGEKVTARLLAAAVTDFDEDVKAVTYHEAEVVQLSDDTWSTTLVLDL